MDPTDLIRQAQSSLDKARQTNPTRGSNSKEDEILRINSYTLTACCRCRQRKTRCDPGLPRCLPCQRSGSICEYFDRNKNRNMSRNYILHLQDNLWALEKKLSQLMEEETSPPNTEDMVRPGGFVRLNSDDDTPRFLGPSSGIAMTRLVMEEAKKYTDSRSIRELVPNLREPHIATSEPTVGSKKSYPSKASLPAQTLPSINVAEKLVEVFNQKETAQYFTPTLHEPSLLRDVRNVYYGSSDPYQNFVTRMVLAISLQKLDSAYAGLADGYYVAAIEFLEDVIRPKDLKTLQCLVLVAQYSLLTPTQTAIYYIVGLATRICQQLGLTEEKTIVQDVSLGAVDPIQLDLRRRLAWIVLSMEYGLAHSMGRPNSFASGQDQIGIKFFEAKNDQYITKEGILPGPVSEKKTVAIHFLKMRLLQAEIRRVLYQMKRPEPKDEDHVWFKEIQQKMKNWVDASPHNPSWSRPWFYGRYLTMIVMLFRPSPQVPQPMTRSVFMCYNAASMNIESINTQMKTAMVDITWVFVLTIFQALNTILWTVSYPEIRAKHPRKELETYVNIALDTITRCQSRWPGTEAAAHLYNKLAQACLKIYDSEKNTSLLRTHFSDDGPPHIESLSDLVTDTGSSVKSHKSNNSTGSFDLFQQQSKADTSDQALDPKSEESSNYNFGSSFPKILDPSQYSYTFEIPFHQVDHKFTYFPPENMEPLVFPHDYSNSNEVQPVKQGTFNSPTFDGSYSLHPIPYWFRSSIPKNNLFFTKDSMESLSQQQQSELIKNLEMNGLSEIENLMSLSSS
ncbi:Positive regulator of purine utilization [Golovinomyces cichoracearum]|uniref:Positive regulator of purine utilization n=1 Tax=Golovinomyces cichoracearum TaxID=62708 RepID=A0A420ISC4_9PEZI|nr:Positive regulator of purine utilization [Golovinomyces cichoracearum]